MKGNTLDSFTCIQTNPRLIINLNGSPTLINTGLNQSIGNQPNVTIGGKKFSLDSEIMGMNIKNIQQFTNSEFDIILGADILSQFNILIEKGNNKINFYLEPLEIQGERINFDLFLNIPVLSIKIDGKILEAFFDSSARLSYVSPSYITGYDKTGEVEDFYPSIGSFTSDIYQISSQIGTKILDLSYGVLPMGIQRARNIHGKKAILGAELINFFDLYLDYTNKVMKLIS